MRGGERMVLELANVGNGFSETFAWRSSSPGSCAPLSCNQHAAWLARQEGTKVSLSPSSMKELLSWWLPQVGAWFPALHFLCFSLSESSFCGARVSLAAFLTLQSGNGMWSALYMCTFVWGAKRGGRQGLNKQQTTLAMHCQSSPWPLVQFGGAGCFTGHAVCFCTGCKLWRKEVGGKIMPCVLM